jgi:aldose 1-epimerase
MSLTKEPFGSVNSTEVDLYTLVNKNGASVKITTYGGIVTALSVKDNKGQFGDIVLGFDNVQGYIDHVGPYFGAIIGRYANRIANAKFMLNEKEYHLAANNGPNSLHGKSQYLDSNY